MGQLARQQQLEDAKAALTEEESKTALADVGTLTNMFFHFNPEAGKEKKGAAAK